MSVRRQSADHELIRRARQLRRDMTAPERLIWYALRDRRLAGWKFPRQVVIGPYIVDFYSHAASLVLEIDGDSHADRGASDRGREAWLEGLGLRVVRISNDEVLHGLEGVVEGIADTRLPRDASAGPEAGSANNPSGMSDPHPPLRDPSPAGSGGNPACGVGPKAG